MRATLQWHFYADFADIFEVRGTPRAARGRRLRGGVQGGTVTLGYHGLDNVVRRTRLTFSPEPSVLTATDAHYHLELPPQGEATIDLAVACAAADTASKLLSFAEARAAAVDDQRRARDGG